MGFNYEKFRKDVRLHRTITNDIDMRKAAEEIGTSPATLSRIENGKTCDLETFALLVKWMGKKHGIYFK